MGEVRALSPGGYPSSLGGQSWFPGADTLPLRGLDSIPAPELAYHIPRHQKCPDGHRREKVSRACSEDSSMDEIQGRCGREWPRREMEDVALCLSDA